MTRDYFLTTKRIGFSQWKKEDLELAGLLWGDSKVTKFICATGTFDEDDICTRLNTEISHEEKYHVQYWPFFDLSTQELIGCCGLRPYHITTYEIGFHLRPHYWHQGYAMEAATTIIEYAFSTLKVSALFAGHHPDNKASSRVLLKLGFHYIGDEFYQPTGLYHPSYELTLEDYKRIKNM